MLVATIAIRIKWPVFWIFLLLATYCGCVAMIVHSVGPAGM
jgi:hypothetical protein